MASSKKSAAGKPAARTSASTASAKKGGVRVRPRPARPAPAALGTGATLVVLRDGVVLADEEAAAIWRAFSAHMDEHEGDFAGFAASRGWREVKPEHRRGQAVLVVTA